MTIATLFPRRRRIPNRRAAELYDLSFKGGRYSIGASRFPDGSLAEVFIHAAKASSDLADAARDAAVALSIALQHGTPADAIRAAVTRESDGCPAGIVGAVLDLLHMEGSETENEYARGALVAAKAATGRGGYDAGPKSLIVGMGVVGIAWGVWRMAQE